MASPGAGELTIVLVSVGDLSNGDEFTTALLAELERRKLNVVQTSVADAEDEVAQRNPHLVVLCGTRGAQVLATLLDDGLQGTRPRLVITAPRAELAGLQGLNRNVVAGLLASDLGERLVVERLQTLARQAAQLRLGGFRTPSAPRVEVVSTAPSAPEFFAGVESDIFDPLFPSAAPRKPTPPEAQGVIEQAAPQTEDAPGGEGTKIDTPRDTAATKSPPEVTPKAEAPRPFEAGAAPAAAGAGTSRAASPAPQVSRFQSPRTQAPKPQAPKPQTPATRAPRPKTLASNPLDPKTPQTTEPPTEAEPKKAQLQKAEPPRAEPQEAEPRKAEPEKADLKAPGQKPPAKTPTPRPADVAPRAETPKPQPAAPEAPPPPEPARTLESVIPDSEPMSVADAELQADDIEDLTSIAAPATPSIPVDMTPPPLPASAGLPPVAPSRLIALAEPRDPNTDATSPLPPATQDAEAASPAASSPTVTGARAEAGAAPEQPSPSASGTKPATAAVPANAPEAPSTPTPSRAKSAGRGLALVAVLAAVGVGVFFALPKKEATETPRVQGVAPAQNQSPEGAASSNPGETAPSGAESPDAQAPERNDDASAASPEKTTAERADPLLVAEAELGGCAPLLAGFEPRMVDPVQEASLAWKEAREQIVKGDLVAVERKMCEAVQLHPQSAALEGLAMLYLNQRAPRRALTYLEKAEAVRPGETETLNLRGDIHSQLGEGEQALSAWLRALKLDAGDAARRRMAALEYANQGQGQFRRGALPQAERWFRRAAALDPTNVVALVGLAEVFLKTERLPSAAALARQTLTVSELQPQAHVVLGDVARAAGDTAEARASYERALAVRSDHWPAKARLRELAAGQ